MIKINFKAESFLSPLGIFAIYIIASALAIIGFRFIFPGEAVPLAYYSGSWRIINGLLDFFSLFPALAISALIIPFGFKEHPHERIAPFSAKFLQSLKLPIITAIIAAALYGIILFLALPVAANREANIRFRSRLYTHAKEMAEKHAQNGDWHETAKYIGICEQIWPNSQEMLRLKTEAEIRLEGERYIQARFPESWQGQEYSAERGGRASPPETTWPEQTADMTPVRAFEMAETALAEERFFDAHWLATLGGRLAGEGSPERAQSARIAGQAWNAINSTAPNARETEAHNVFRLKREGYEAFLGSEWIRAYYIFLELMEISPQDPDVQKYFALGGSELRRVAFFLDEIDMTMGSVTTEAVFSLPSAGLQTPGRFVLRLSSLSTFSDNAYGLDAELFAVDINGLPLWRITAPYVKFLPMTLDSGPAVSLLMRTLDRTDKTRQLDPLIETFGQNNPLSGGGAEFVLPLAWDSFILLSNMRRGLSGLSPAELRTAANTLGSYGYQGQVFEMELLQRFAMPLFLLPLGIFAIVVGWRYRALKRSLYIGIPMLIILPAVLNGAAHFCKGWLNNLGVWAVVSLGFNTAAVILGVGILLLFVSSLIILAAQHD